MDPKEKFNAIALSCISYLESFDEVNEVFFQCGGPLENRDFSMWERTNLPYKLPIDLKGFYSLFNGFQLRWDLQAGDRLVEIGSMRVNSVNELVRMPIEGTFMMRTTENDSDLVPDSKSAAFMLDSSSEVGIVCLLYWHRSGNSLKDSRGVEEQYDSDPEVWFVDLSSRWHFVAQSFTHYLRLVVTHCGIYGWQLAFTPEGLPPTTVQWMNLFCKERLFIDRYFDWDGSVVQK